MSKQNPDSESAFRRIDWLLTQVRKGDDRERDELVELVYRRLEHLSRSNLSGFPGLRAYEQTGDVLGETWPRLLKSLRERDFRDSGHFFSYTAVLIRNVLIDLLRKHCGRGGKKPREVAVDTFPEGSGATGWKQTRTPDRDLMLQECHVAIENLEEKHQEMFNLRFYHGLREWECAEELGVDERTVRRRWREAQLALEAALDR